MTDMTDRKDKKPISFGFSKKKDKQPVIEKSAIAEKDREDKKETDFILELEGKEVKSVKPKEEEKEFIIPLIQRNVWREKKVKEKSEVKDDGEKKNSIDDEAAKELIKEAAMHNDEWQQRGTTDLNLSIPLLMRNRVPEGYEEDERLDVSLRPEQTTEEDYDRIPIEQFGMAMLRGMGFKKEEGIGSKMKKSVDPIEVTVRPKGQGLGADKRPVMPKKQVKRKPGDKKEEEEEPVGIAKGVGVLVTSGPHKNLYGKIEGVDEDNARVVIKLAISSQLVTLSQYGVQLVDKEEYKKNAKDLGKFSKGHDELAKRKDKDKDEDRKRHERRKKNGHDYESQSDYDRKRDKEERRHRKRHSDYDSDNRSDYERTSKKKYDDHERTSSKRHKDDYNRDGYKEKKEHDRHDNRKDSERDREDRDRRRHKDKYREDRRSKNEERSREEEKRENDRHDKKEKRKKVEDDYREEQAHDSNVDTNPSKPRCYWLRPDLRVRFIDKNYKKGRYYNSKVAIIDVVTMDTCTCRNDEGRLLEDVNQDMVETLIPKTDPAYVMVVQGQLKGQLGTVIKRNKEKCQAAVQLLQDRDQIVKLDYNDICEYVGDIQANEDY